VADTFSTARTWPLYGSEFDEENPWMYAAARLPSGGDIAEHALAIYEPRCATAGIAVRRSIASSAKVVLRRDEMMQIISNLVRAIH
jgi:hypothetical protein